MIETVDIVESLVSQLDFTFIIDSCTDNLDGTYTLATCNTYQLQTLPNCPISIDGSSYVITEVVNNQSITIKGTSKPIVTEFAIPKPFYFHGTAIKTNIELSKIDTFNKFPMVYLLEVLQDRFFARDEVNERETDLRLFFLAPSKFGEWTTDDHYKGAILPMRNLAYQFIKVLNDSKLINNFAEYTLINRVNFGVYVTDKGNESRIFNDDLSGVEMRITLPIKRNLNCNNCLT